MQPSDLAVRQHALDVSQSFIIQAPAGSGKTALLVQRFLKLLTTVNTPEEVLAITFTRKAAYEMRERILTTLKKAKNSPCPSSGYQRDTWLLADEVLRKDAQAQWNLLDSPGQLQLMTIDAFCARLASQLPLLSRWGASVQVEEDMTLLFKQVAKNVLTAERKSARERQSVRQFLQHLGNHYQDGIELISNMLGKRHAWLPLLLKANQEESACRAWFQKGIQEAVEHLIKITEQLFFQVIFWDELSPLIFFAVAHLPLDHPLRHWPDKKEEMKSALLPWQALADWLLTKQGEWRKSVRKDQGFPAPSSLKGEEKARASHMKKEADTLLKTLAQSETSSLLKLYLKQLRLIDSVEYDEMQWATLWSLFSVLKQAVGELWLQFQRSGQADFNQVALCALDALYHEHGPTDLSLSLDYRLKHILCDEFQDTSRMQISLLESLTLGWQEGDGRTLFCVGDPMQSIYRFRYAEVEAYLDVWQHGIGDIRLTPLRLTTNFRSQKTLVAWFNQMFAAMFPKKSDKLTGAVEFSSAFPMLQDDVGGVDIDFCMEGEEVQAQHVAQKVDGLLRESNDEHIAILVRSRTHLTFILPALQQHGIPYQAVEIERLGQKVVVIDLTSLTRALSYPNDRLAWFSVLRAPWCGLSLEDLEKIAVFKNMTDVIYELDPLEIQGLSVDGKNRLSRVLPVLREAWYQRDRQPFSRFIQGVWEALGGPACLEKETDLEDANVFFSLLSQATQHGRLVWKTFCEKLDKLNATTTGDAVRVHVMTIHKSKGLEFDHVILPSLHRSGGRIDKSMLLWLSSGLQQPIVAPVYGRHQKDELYQWIKSLESKKEAYEHIRLLYVAATRAKQSLHLMACLTLKEGTLQSPRSGSFLSYLWPMVSHLAERLIEVQSIPVEGESERASLPEKNLRRLPQGWMVPPDAMGKMHQRFEYQLDRASLEEAHGFLNQGLTPDDFVWHDPCARTVGIIVHSMLQEIAKEGVQAWSSERLSTYYSVWRRALDYSGVGSVEAVEEIMKTLVGVLSSKKARVFLDPSIASARSEFALSTYRFGRRSNFVIDRTWLDSNGVRFILDFKTASPKQETIETFLDHQMMQYAAQMRNYEQLFSEKVIKTGLYFPRLDVWAMYHDLSNPDLKWYLFDPEVVTHP